MPTRVAINGFGRIGRQCGRKWLMGSWRGPDSAVQSGLQVVEAGVQQRDLGGQHRVRRLPGFRRDRHNRYIRRASAGYTGWGFHLHAAIEECRQRPKGFVTPVLSRWTGTPE